MMHYKAGDLGKYLVIKPEGWVDELVFSLDYTSSCGITNHGMGISVGRNQPGGALTVDDLLQIRDAINKHLTKVIAPKE